MLQSWLFSAKEHNRYAHRALELTDSITERSKRGKSNKNFSLKMLCLYRYNIIISYSKIEMFTVLMFIAFKVKVNTFCMWMRFRTQQVTFRLTAPNNPPDQSHRVSKLPVPAWFQFDWFCSWSQACTINTSPLVSSYMCCIPTVDSLCAASHRCTGCPQN